ncbi:replication initiator protein [Whitefly associated Guatemala alphasatellite 1]|uniref:Replication initiator protein n=1 Tax=Whitefly associated Guatemala alphasatellite 1 TaxID=2560838 RepID=A0A0X9EM11_9VIRU|nr:replication initiator protein [Whitefly associated Guatemala alphasatellite 1]ALK03648.1 replication initiator protein [Whitefly associated Guatemala alphasatellite 1]
MKTPQSIWWCFTIFFASAGAPELFPLFENTSVSYACWQEEESPTTHRRHLQGYLQLKSKKTLNQVKALFGDLNPHLEKQRARNSDDARDYCLKEASRVSGPWEFGEYCPSGSHKRRQREQVQKSPERMMEENPSVYRRVKARLSIEAHQLSLSELPFLLKPWQFEIERVISRPASTRDIIWVYGSTGGEGKSTYARELLRRGWFYTRGGSVDNVAYQYLDNVDRDVVFDIPRDKKDYLQYSLIEMIKDGVIISNKYEPVTAVCSRPRHVVVMSNFLPDFSKISVDRVSVIPCIPCGLCLNCHSSDVFCLEFNNE